MTNNDILRRLRYCFEFNDNKMISLFDSAGLSVTKQQLHHWLKKDDDADFVLLTDSQFAAFLNGFINDKRGNKDGAKPALEKRLTNNIILTKLKIALNLKAEDIIELLASVDFRLSKPELSAFFRKADHKHYRECKDQLLRNFIRALQQKYRVSPAPGPSNQGIQPVANTQNNKKVHTNKKDERKPLVAREARPNASAIYINPNAKVKTSENKKQSTGNTLKLKAKEIWKNSPQ